MADLDRHKDRRAERETHRPTERHTDRHTDIHTHRQTDRQTDRGTHTQTEEEVFLPADRMIIAMDPGSAAVEWIDFDDPGPFVPLIDSDAFRAVEQISIALEMLALSDSSNSK